MKIGVAGEWKFKTTDCRGLVYSDNLLEILRKEEVRPQKAAPQHGDGSLKSPYQKLNLANWYYLSQQPLRFEPIYYLVGERLIARWGNGAVDLKNYCTDVTGLESEVEKATGTDKKPYDDFVHNLGKVFESSDDKLGINKSLPSYTRKALRVDQLDDRAAAARCRSLFVDSDTSCTDCPELASSFCALFIGEASRSPITFVISLMLLDLIETSTTYGEGEAKKYTWKSMLMYGNTGVDIPGRSTGIKELGKHPMAGKGTVDKANHLFDVNSGKNLVRDRVISLLAVWLAHYLQQHVSDTKFFILKAATAHEEWSGARGGAMDAPSKLVHKECRKGVLARCASADVLIGGTRVFYQNLEGKLV